MSVDIQRELVGRVAFSAVIEHIYLPSLEARESLIFVAHVSVGVVRNSRC